MYQMPASALLGTEILDANTLLSLSLWAPNDRMATPLGLRIVPQTDFTPDRSSLAWIERIVTLPSATSGGSKWMDSTTGGVRSELGSTSTGSFVSGGGVTSRGTPDGGVCRPEDGARTAARESTGPGRGASCERSAERSTGVVAGGVGADRASGPPLPESPRVPSAPACGTLAHEPRVAGGGESAPLTRSTCPALVDAAFFSP